MNNAELIFLKFVEHHDVDWGTSKRIFCAGTLCSECVLRYDHNFSCNKLEFQDFEYLYEKFPEYKL